MKLEIDLINDTPDDLRLARSIIDLKLGKEVPVGQPAFTKEELLEHGGPSLTDTSRGFAQTPPPAPITPPPAPVAPIAPPASIIVPPAPVAPVAPPAPATPPAPAGSIEVDASGLPWDARIHSREKTKNADGNWRDKRKVDKTLRDAIVAELRAAMAGAPSAPAAPVAAAPLAAVPPAPLAPTPPAPVIPAAPPAPSAPAAPPAPATPVAISFSKFMRILTVRVNAGKAVGEDFQALYVQPALAALQMPNFNTLMQRPDLLPGLMVTLGLKDDGQP
jgi:hypothetical protein